MTCERAAALTITVILSACATPGQRSAVAPAAFADTDSTWTTTIAPGVTHTFVRDARGPWAIHVVETDTRLCNPILVARKAGPPLRLRATASALSAGALAGINADFFMLPGGTPVGTHVTAGVPLIGPTDRHVFAVTRNGWRIGAAQVVGHARVNDDSAAIAQVNRPARAFPAYRGTTSGITLFTTWTGDTVPADTAARRLIVRVLDGNEAAGRAVVVTSDSPAVSTDMQDRTAVLHAHGTARDWARRRAAGDTVSWSSQIVVDAPAIEAVGGFPQLLRAGRPVLPDQSVAEGFGDGRHPRTAIGWTADGRLLFVVVDGRQPPHSDGMSLDELTWLFQRLGASDALNLDGGGSTALVVKGAVVNRPSDREGERAVGNALVLAGCR